MSVASLIKAQWLSCGFFQQPPLMKNTNQFVVFVDAGKQRIFREMSGLVFRNAIGGANLNSRSKSGPGGSKTKSKSKFGSSCKLHVM